MKHDRNVRFVTTLVAMLGATTSFAQVDCEGTVPIYEIQGKTHVSPYAGVTVETCGVVTATGFQTYYIQDPVGDGDPETSDGINIFDPRSDAIPEVGTLVRLRDEVSEFIPGGADTGNLSTTNFAFPEILASEAGTPLPAPVVIGRGGRIPPAIDVISPDETDPPINLQDAVDAAANRYNPDNDGIDFYESLEGMLVTVEQPVAVSAIRQFSGFSAEFFVLANNGADALPFDARTDRGGILLQPDPDNRGDQNPERVQIQLGFANTEYPAIAVGDFLGDITGVVGYSFGNYEINALATPEVFPRRQRPERARGPRLGYLSIASYNVLNLSAVANDDAQRELIARQIVRNLSRPDIVALQEIQDNNGDEGDCADDDPSPCAGVLDASETLQKLVDAIVAAGGPRYRFFTVDPLQETTQTEADGPDVFGGIPLGNIRNAFLYDPRRARLIEYTGLTREVLADRGVSVPTAYDFSRDPLEGVFWYRGQRVVVLNNHFTSRFGSTPIFGGPQPFVQFGEETREAQSLAMNEVTQWWLGQDESANVVVLGDLNTFEFTNDLAEILPGTGDEQILYNLFDLDPSNDRYSFIFDGNSQALDHIFVTRPLLDEARFEFVQVNVDLPRRFEDVTASDHEPLLTRLRIGRFPRLRSRR